MSSFRSYIAVCVSAPASSGSREARVEIAACSRGGFDYRLLPDPCHPSSAPAAELLGLAGDLPIVVYGPELGADLIRGWFCDTDGSRVVDARFVACCLLPSLREHDIESVSSFLNVSAGTLPELIGKTFDATLACLAEQGLTALQTMFRIADGTGSAITSVIEEAIDRCIRVSESTIKTVQPEGAGDPQVPEGQFAPTCEGRVGTGRTGPREDVEPDEILGILGPGGACSRSLCGYEHRSSQLDLAAAVANNLRMGGFLVAEAGTGTGKSLAYLVPALLWAARNNECIVVSTNTKPLQDQLFFKDLAFLSSTMDTPVSYALLKGRSNYICMNRWDFVLRRLETCLSREERIAALLLVVWAAHTKTGDIAENSSFDPARFADLWNKVCSDPIHCAGQLCRSNRRCCCNNARRIAKTCNVIVVNHSLLFSDLASDHSVLPEYRHLILDEAHNVEKSATNYLGRSLALWDMLGLAERLHSARPVETGLLASLRRVLRGRTDIAGLQAIEAQMQLINARASKVVMSARSWFENTAGALCEAHGQSTNPTVQMKVRYDCGHPLQLQIQSSVEGLGGALGELIQALGELQEWLRDLENGSFADQDELATELAGQVGGWRGLASALEFLSEAKDEDYVYWVETDGTPSARRPARLVSAPLNVAERLRELLYPRLESAVFTSATLSIKGRFGYLMGRLGLDPEMTETLCLPSPFNYEDQALVCIPTYLASPKDDGFATMVAQTISRLIAALRKGMLVLFTSFSTLQQVHRVVKQTAALHDVRLLAQGIDGDRSQLLALFRDRPGSVLFGVASFWEGIDLPGEALEILVITRLPFSVPTEPVVQARMEQTSKEGRDPFTHYSLPEAALRLRQGFGRLIRNRTDRGVVIILDRRTTTKAFGKVFLDVLPAPKRVFASPEELVEGVKKWFSGQHHELQTSGVVSPGRYERRAGPQSEEDISP